MKEKDKKPSARRYFASIAGTGGMVSVPAFGADNDYVYPALELVADTSLYPARADRYEQDAATLFRFFLHHVPWETWDKFEELSQRRSLEREKE